MVATGPGVRQKLGHPVKIGVGGRGSAEQSDLRGALQVALRKLKAPCPRIAC